MQIFKSPTLHIRQSHLAAAIKSSTFSTFSPSSTRRSQILFLHPTGQLSVSQCRLRRPNSSSLCTCFICRSKERREPLCSDNKYINTLLLLGRPNATTVFYIPFIPPHISVYNSTSSYTEYVESFHRVRSVTSNFVQYSTRWCCAVVGELVVVVSVACSTG